jgi:CRISPR-associated protein Csm3
MTNQFLGKYILKASLECLTGLHIGGSTTGLEIGGLDNPVVKDPLTSRPYIPGSSLKGKLRSLLEWKWGLIKGEGKNSDKYEPYHCDELRTKAPADPRWQDVLRLARLFGPHSNEPAVRELAGPTRLTVRDSFLSSTTAKDLQDTLGEEIFTEVKIENALDRVTSAANPRPMERVPKGSQFDAGLILDVYEMQPDIPSKELIKSLFSAMSMLEHSALGGGGSRGSGQIKFKGIQVIWRSTDDYQSGQPGVPVMLPGENANEILNEFAKVQWPK